MPIAAYQTSDAVTLTADRATATPVHLQRADATVGGVLDVLVWSHLSGTTGGTVTVQSVMQDPEVRDLAEAASTTTNVNLTAHGFEAGDMVAIHDVSADTWECRRIASETANQIVVTPALSGAPAVGDEVYLAHVGPEATGDIDGVCASVTASSPGVVFVGQLFAQAWTSSPTDNVGRFSVGVSK